MTEFLIGLIVGALTTAYAVNRIYRHWVNTTMVTFFRMFKKLK